MSSMFDTAVYNRRKQTPWARINVIQFLKDMCFNDEEHRTMSLSVHYRPDVASRFWWVINWTGADGERHEQSAQELDLCLWRAAEAELRIEERLGLENKTQLTMRAPDLPKAGGSISVTCPNCGTFIGVDFSKSASG